MLADLLVSLVLVLLAFAGGVVVGPRLLGEPVDVVWHRRLHCEARDMGAYDAVIVGPDAVHTEYVWTGGRLRDDDPRWRAWGKLWMTCKSRPSGSS
jgi:hypothetical protein